jgi:hypothetical protein
MATNLTYREIVDEFDAACTAHLQIASFDSGTIDFLDASAVNRLYPFIFLRPMNTLVSGNVRTLSFELYSLDVPRISGGSNIDVVSNTEQYLWDLMAWFNVGTTARQQTYDVIMNSATPVNEAFQDRVFGWMGNIDILSPFALDYCNYPQL